MNIKNRRPRYFINSFAPIRICDNGGWTDTWFAEHGEIFNIAVAPFAEVQIAVYERMEREARVIINAENFGDRYAVNPDKGWDRHPLLEATIAFMPIPDDVSIEVTIYSEAPAGASTGTSAAVTVALIGALDFLSPGCMNKHEVASTAHKIETEVLGQESGVQDQLCSAYGGINYIQMHQYPQANVSQIEVPDDVLWELERRLVLIYLGRSHSSSRVHEMVIQSLEQAGPECQQLNDLRATAGKSRDAIANGDLHALGLAMKENTEAQRRLHPELVNDDACRVIEIANEHGASGWKVNGAGGEGGSVTILNNAFLDLKRPMIRKIEAQNSLYRIIPVRLARSGLRVWKKNWR